MPRSLTCCASHAERLAGRAPAALPRQCHGFTLVEVLAALAVFGLLSVMLLSAITFGATAWKRETSLERGTDDIATVNSALRRLLSNAYPLYRRIDDKHGVVVFDGTGDRLEFLAPTPEALGAAGLTRFRLELSPGSGGERLVVRAQPELTQHPDDWMTSTLIDHVRRLRIQYYGGAADGAVWLSSWASQPQLPRLVRVDLELDTRGRTADLETTIALAISEDAQCVYAADAAHRCRDR